MLLNMYKNLENMHNRGHQLLILKLMLRLNFEKKIKIKSLVAWSISEGRVDQKQIINFVRPNLCIIILGLGSSRGGLGSYTMPAFLDLFQHMYGINWPYILNDFLYVFSTIIPVDHIKGIRDLYKNGQ